MDLELNPIPTKSDDSEIDTPPHTHAQTIKPSSFTNGARKNRHHQPPPPAVVAYRECMKNHAAALGGHAVDGCCEYMPLPSSSAAPTDPTLLRCAACGCHRSFHRRKPDSSTTAIAPPFLDFRLPAAQPKRTSPSTSPPIPESPCAPHTLLALSTAVAAEEHHQDPPVTPTGENPVGRKRSRTKFSQEQKEKMHSFSEKLGWKMLKADEAAVEEFCKEVGVAKGVLRVWMHNHKNMFWGKEITRSRNNIINGKLISFENNNGGKSSSRKNEEMRNIDNGSHFQNESGSRVHYHGSNNVSCSSI